MSLGGRVSEKRESDGGVVVRQTGIISGTTSRTSESHALVFPETVGCLGHDEILSGGESTKPLRDPDLHSLDLDPLPFSASPSSSSSISISSRSSSSNATSGTNLPFPESLTRLDTSLDLAKLRVELDKQLVQDYWEPVLVTTQQARTEAHDLQCREEHPGYTQDGLIITNITTNITTTTSTTSRWKDVEETGSDTTFSTCNSSTYYSETDPEDRPSSSYETFFDPSSSSAEASPTSPSYPDAVNHNRSNTGDRFAPAVSTMVPELSEPINSKLSSTPSSPAGPDTTAAATATASTSMHWRPRSAPKTSHSRSASPLVFWNKKGNQHPNQQQQQHQQQRYQQQQEQGARDSDADWFVAEKKESQDATYVDSISNHLGKMTTPARSGPKPPNGRADLKDSTLANGGGQDEDQATTPPPITKEEYEALPLAIQRKVSNDCFALAHCPSTLVCFCFLSRLVLTRQTVARLGRGLKSQLLFRG